MKKALLIVLAMVFLMTGVSFAGGKVVSSSSASVSSSNSSNGKTSTGSWQSSVTINGVTTTKQDSKTFNSQGIITGGFACVPPSGIPELGGFVIPK